MVHWKPGEGRGTPCQAHSGCVGGRAAQYPRPSPSIGGEHEHPAHTNPTHRHQKRLRETRMAPRIRHHARHPTHDHSAGTMAHMVPRLGRILVHPRMVPARPQHHHGHHIHHTMPHSHRKIRRYYESSGGNHDRQHTQWYNSGSTRQRNQRDSESRRTNRTMPRPAGKYPECI